MKDKYDIVVVGSGIGGLVSAALLSDSGKKILIVEKEPKPGGYLTEFKCEDYTFDVSLHLLNGCGQGQYVHRLFERCRISDRINFLRPKYLYRSVFPDFDIRVPQSNVSAYREMLVSLFPDSRKGIENLFDEICRVFNLVSNFVLSGRISSELASYIAGNCETSIGRHINDRKLKAVICQLWIYFGLPPSLLRSIDFYYPWFDYIDNGGYYLEKGSYEIVRALVSRIKASGGDFIFNNSVDRILFENDSYGKVAFGKEETTCDTIISNIDIARTVHGLVGSKQFSPEYIKKLGCIVPSISAFEIFLGLKIDLKRAYPDDYEIFVNAGYDIDKQYRDCVNNNAKAAPFVITINSNVNRFSAPEGHSVVTIIMLAGHKYWDTESIEEYKDKKDRIADILIDRASKIIPEIKTHLQKKIVSTPITFERYTNNSEGAIYGYSRTVGRKNEVRTNEMKGIKNLYFASAWARQGSGVAKVLHSAEDVCRKIASTEREKVAA